MSGGRRSSATRASASPRPWCRRSVTRSSVKASTRYCWRWSPVRLRTGATATAIFGSTQGHSGPAFLAIGAKCRWIAGLAGSPARAFGKAAVSRSGISAAAAGGGTLTGRARTRYLVSERLGFSVRSDSKFAFQDFGAGAVLPQRFRPPPRVSIGADQRALTNLRERVRAPPIDAPIGLPHHARPLRPAMPSSAARRCR